MKIYNIKDEYIAFLKSFDAKVADNKHAQRPYIGVVLQIHDIKYYAPLSSPKPKHKKLKNTKDLRKINQGIYGVINFNNMIPVMDPVLTLIDIDHLEDKQYRRLLQNQYTYIRADAEQIIKTAQKLHTLIFTEDSLLNPYDKIVKQRCCDLPLLESHFEEYSNLLTAQSKVLKL